MPRPRADAATTFHGIEMSERSRWRFNSKNAPLRKSLDQIAEPEAAVAGQEAIVSCFKGEGVEGRNVLASVAKLDE